MKRFTLLAFFFTICLAAITNAQGNWVRQWDHRYGGTDGDYVVACEKTSHQGYILAGKTASDSSGNKMTHMIGFGAFDYWIVKVDSMGLMQWEKDIQATGNDQLWSIKVTSDGGYLLAGTSDSPISGDKTQASRGGTDYWVIKLDSTGNIQWDKTFGGSDDEELRYVMQTSDGGYLIGGDSRSNISGDKTEAKYGVNDFWIVKTDANGVKLWDKEFGGPGYEQFRMSLETSDHGLIIAGISSSGIGGNKTDVSQGGADYWIVRTDSVGTILWDSAYGGLGDDNLQALILTPGEGILVGGWSTTDVSGDKTQPTQGSYDFWILKLNSAGTILWDKDFGGTVNEDEFTCIYPAYDGGFFLGATSYSNAGGDKSEDNLGVEQPWIIKIDSSGNKLWDKTILTNGHNEIGIVKETLDHKCFVVISGDNGDIGGDKTEDAWGNFSSDYWIVKYCQGKGTGIDDITFSEDELLVYPNPFLDDLKIKLSSDSHSSLASAILYDIVGNKVISQKFNTETSLNTSNISRGIYILEVSADGKSSRKKIIK